MIKARDADGMTLLHHAVSGKGGNRVSTQAATTAADADAAPRATPAGVSTPPTDTGHEGGTHGIEMPPFGERLDAATGEGDPLGGQAGAEPPFVLDPRLPVIQSVLEFARDNLWMPEVGVDLGLLLHAFRLLLLRMLFTRPHAVQKVDLPQVPVTNPVSNGSAPR